MFSNCFSCPAKCKELLSKWQHVANDPSGRREEPSVIFRRTQAFSGCFPAMEISPSDPKTNRAAERNPTADSYRGNPEVLLKIQTYKQHRGLFSQFINMSPPSIIWGGLFFFFWEGGEMDQTGIASSLFVLSARKKKQQLRVRSCLGLAAAGGSSSALCSSVLVPGSRRLPAFAFAGSAASPGALLERADSAGRARALQPGWRSPPDRD